jgi:hypothetical protein
MTGSPSDAQGLVGGSIDQASVEKKPQHAEGSARPDRRVAHLSPCEEKRQHPARAALCRRAFAYPARQSWQNRQRRFTAAGIA